MARKKKNDISYENEYVHFMLGTDMALQEVPKTFPEELQDAYVSTIYVNLRPPERTTSVHINHDILFLILLAELGLTIAPAEMFENEGEIDESCTIQPGWTYFLYEEEGEKAGERVGYFSSNGDISFGPFKGFHAFFLVVPYGLRKTIQVALMERCEASRIAPSAHTGRYDLPLRDCPKERILPPWVLFLKPFIIPFILLLLLIVGLFMIIFVMDPIDISSPRPAEVSEEEKDWAKAQGLSVGDEEETVDEVDPIDDDEWLKQQGLTPDTTPSTEHLDDDEWLKQQGLTPDTTIAPTNPTQLDEDAWLKEHNLL